MIYAVSDIHGHYDTYFRLLREIDLRLYEEVRAGGEDYVLVHAGLAHFPGSAAGRLPPRRADSQREGSYNTAYWPDRYVVCGHTPTQQIPDSPELGRIYRADRRIFIDCGRAFGGPLGALCLDTGDVFYV